MAQRLPNCDAVGAIRDALGGASVILKAVIINDYAFVQGGADQAAVSSAEALAVHGVSVHFIAGSGETVSPQLNHSNIKVSLLGASDLLSKARSPVGLFTGIWNPQVAGKLRKLLSAHSPTDAITHVHSYTKALTSAIFPVLRKEGFEPLLTLHEYFVACPNGAFYEFPSSKLCDRRPLSLECVCTQCDRRSYAQKLWRCGRQIVQHAFARVPSELRHIIYVSEHSLNVLKAHLARDVNKYHVRLPIDVVRESWSDASRNSVFLFAGRLAREKAPEHLAKAALLAGVDCRFAGDGELRSHIESINPGAHITGWLDRSRLRDEIRRCRALVFTSMWHESFGLVVAEALAMGRPVVVSDITAAAEQVTHGVNGFLYSAGRVEVLASVLQQLKDDELVKRMGIRAYEDYWVDPPTPGRHAEQLLRIYDSVLLSQKVSEGQDC